MLPQLRDLPRLTALQLSLAGYGAVDHIMEGLTLDHAVAALRAVLPTQLRSFSVTAGSRDSPLGVQATALVSSFWAALTVMTQLTELRIEQRSDHMRVGPDLAGLAHLRKLTLGPAGERGEHVAEVKQLSQLRELTLHDNCSDRLRLLCQPPHALQLESITLTALGLHEWTVRALLNLPTLTALHPARIQPDEWPLLAQLPRLRRLSFSTPCALSPEPLSSLCASLSRCAVLEDLMLSEVYIVSNVGSRLLDQQKQAGWAALLSSVPNLRRLCVEGDSAPLLTVLPLHLPRLEELSLSDCDADHFATLAHPNLRLLEFWPSEPPPPSEEEVRSWMGGERLPKLERYIRHP
jgi:hypothetical protein